MASLPAEHGRRQANDVRHEGWLKVQKWFLGNESSNLKLTTGADPANEARRQKSRSGGLLQLGHHLARRWFRHQAVIAFKQRRSRVVQLSLWLDPQAGIGQRSA